MTANPYDAPVTSCDATASRGARRPVSVLILLFLFCVTLLLGLINAVQEEHFAMLLCLLLGVLAGVSQLPGLAVALVGALAGARLALVAYVPLLSAAYLIAASSVLIYGLYVCEGKADSSESAAHMHVVLFPLFHCVLTAILYVVAGLIVVVLTLLRRSALANSRQRD